MLLTGEHGVVVPVVLPEGVEALVVEAVLEI
jgi:hypothetical protein